MILNGVQIERKKKRIKQYVLASKVNVHPSVISLVETGKLEADKKLKRKLAKALDCKVSDLFPESAIATRFDK